MTQENQENSNKSHIVDAENLDVDYDFRITHYKMDENGNYEHQLQSDWGGRNAIVNQSWEIVKERIRDAKEKVLKGELSPVAYYMEKCLTDVSTLSKYVGIAKWRVKRHLKPKVFTDISTKVLQKYVDFFQITLDELRNIEANKK